MNEREKSILMTSVNFDGYLDFKNEFNRYELSIEDDSFFDYDLLKAALTREHKAIANFLVKAGCRVRNPSKINPEETPLHLAMKLNCGRTITQILKSGASIYDKNHEGETPLYAAFKETYLTSYPLRKNFDCAIDTVINYYYCKDVQSNNSMIHLNPENKDDILHFHIACITNKVNAVKQFLRYGFDVNSPFNLDFEEFAVLYPFPLHYAAARRHIKLFISLLQHGADISIPNGRGETPLHVLYTSAHFVGYSPYPYLALNESRDMISHVFRYGNNTKFVNRLNSNGVSHFHICCTTNYPNSVQTYLDKGVDINSTIPSESNSQFSGCAPLHLAVFFAREEVVELLLKNGVECNKRDNKYGQTPLHMACRLTKGAKSIIQLLLDYKACVSIVDNKGQTPLHEAFYYKDRNPEIFDMIVSKIPREINISDYRGFSNFHIVSTNNYLLSLVEDFLKSGVAIDSSVVSGWSAGYTALHFAVLYNQKDVVEMLLKWNAQVNIKTSEEQLTPLHIACNYFHMEFLRAVPKKGNFDWTSKHNTQLEIINLLLLHGADVNAQDSLGRTPLLYTFKGRVKSYFHFSYTDNWDLHQINTQLKKIMLILLSKEANINALTHSQQSIMHIISENDSLESCEELLEFFISKGVDTDTADVDGFTPLHLAAKAHNATCVEFFIKRKANVNAKSKDFKIPLTFVVEDALPSNKKDKILLLLLEHGSDVNLRYENDRILWLDALEKRSFCTIESLLNYGADINAEDSLGNPLIVSLFSKWQTDTRDWINKDWITKVNAFHFIFMFLQKLRAAGFYVNDKIQKCCSKLRQLFRNMLDVLRGLLGDNNHLTFGNIFNSCDLELAKMKFIKIDNYNTSLHSILFKSTHELSKLLKNSTLVKILEDENIDHEFPMYSCLLKAKFKKALIRSEILESANASLFFVMGLHLPDICCDLIFQYLANEEINYLKAAGTEIDATKLQKKE